MIHSKDKCQLYLWKAEIDLFLCKNLKVAQALEHSGMTFYIRTSWSLQEERHVKVKCRSHRIQGLKKKILPHWRWVISHILQHYKVVCLIILSMKRKRIWWHTPLTPSAWEAEASRSLSSRPAWSTKWIPGQPGLHRETLSRKTKQNKEKNWLLSPRSWVQIPATTLWLTTIHNEKQIKNLWPGASRARHEREGKEGEE